MFTQSEIWLAIDRLATRQGWSPSKLAVRAGLDPTALNLSKRKASDGRPRWPSTETISKLLVATSTTLDGFCKLVGEGAARAGVGSRAAILVVDDDPAFAQWADASLRRDGYTVALATGHVEALDMIEGGQSFDLLCTDIVMPEGLGGPALAKLARARLPDLKVLYVTGYDIPGTDAGFAIRTLRKPFTESAFRHAVESALALLVTTRAQSLNGAEHRHEGMLQVPRIASDPLPPEN